MLTVPQAAARVGLTEETIRRWIRSGKLPARKVGTQHVIRAEDLRRAARTSRVGEEAPRYEIEAAEPAADRAALLRRIVASPDVLFGKPRVKGTRISVEFALGELAGGRTIDQIADDYPTITADDVRACLAFAQSELESLRILAL